MASGAEPGLVAVDMSTIAPAAAPDRRGTGGAGIDFVDAPVSGGEVGAIAGTLSIMAGGSEAVLRAHPAFACMGKEHRACRRLRCRPGGKAANQIVTGMGVLAVAGPSPSPTKNGVDAGKVREALPSGFAYSRILETTASACSTAISKPGFKELDARKGLEHRDADGHELGSACRVRRPPHRCSMPWSAQAWVRGRLHRRAQVAGKAVGAA